MATSYNLAPVGEGADPSTSRGSLSVPDRNPDYSTLEVLPEGTLEVDRSASLPEVDPGTDPEAIPKSAYPPAYASTYSGAAQEKRHTDSRKWLWIVFSIVVFSIGIGVGVGVGVGVSRGEKSFTGSNDDALFQGRVNPISNLAATNYTDTEGNEHSQVYYQDGSLQIWMADWDESTNIWSLSRVQAVDNTTAIDPKNGTAIAAYNYWPDNNPDNQSDFKLAFMDNSSTVHVVWAFNRDTHNWKMNDDKIVAVRASPDTILAGYSRQCPSETCASSAFTVYSDVRGYPNIKYPSDNYDGWVLPANVSADKWTTVAVVPVPKRPRQRDEVKRIAMYLRSSDGRMLELHQAENSTKWFNINSSNLTIDKGSKIAAMSNLGEDQFFNAQVLTSKTNGGVRLSYLGNGSWSSVDSVKNMENVLPLSPIAATQAGRVYAFEEGPQIVEWLRVDGEVPTFNRVGVVNTTKA